MIYSFFLNVFLIKLILRVFFTAIIYFTYFLIEVFTVNVFWNESLLENIFNTIKDF